MAGKQSAGLLLYRHSQGVCLVFLVHLGGPFWKAKDFGAWSLPKGEFELGEDPLQAANREFTEETGLLIAGNFSTLAPAKQPGGKVVYAFAVEADCDPAAIKSNTFSLEWPPARASSGNFPRWTERVGAASRRPGSGLARGRGLSSTAADLARGHVGVERAWSVG